MISSDVGICIVITICDVRKPDKAAVELVESIMERLVDLSGHSRFQSVHVLSLTRDGPARSIGRSA